MWKEVLDVFLQSYEPVERISESTDQFNTLEIINMLNKGTNQKINPIEVAEILKGLGYTLKHTGGMNVEWLFKVKPIDYTIWQ